jgi:hypothetical protein
MRTLQPGGETADTATYHRASVDDGGGEWKTI